MVVIGLDSSVSAGSTRASGSSGVSTDAGLGTGIETPWDSTAPGNGGRDLRGRLYGAGFEDIVEQLVVKQSIVESSAVDLG